MCDKIIKRHIAQVNKAIKTGNINEVKKVLNRCVENQERNDRYRPVQKTVYLDKTIKNNSGSSYTVGDIIYKSLVDKSETPEKILLRKELYLKLIKFLGALDFEIVILRAIDIRTYSEIAKELGLSDKTVKSHYKKSIERLRNFAYLIKPSTQL